MSARVFAMVLDRYNGDGGGELLLALALANFAHDDGTKIFPSNERLAALSRQSTRTVQIQKSRFEACQWLETVGDAKGGRKRTREYRISDRWLKGEAMLRPFDLSKGEGIAARFDGPKGRSAEAERVQPDAERVQKPALKGEAAAAPDPNHNRQVNQQQQGGGSSSSTRERQKPTRFANDFEATAETRSTLRSTAGLSDEEIDAMEAEYRAWGRDNSDRVSPSWQAKFVEAARQWDWKFRKGIRTNDEISNRKAMDRIDRQETAARQRRADAEREEQERKDAAKKQLDERIASDPDYARHDGETWTAWLKRQESRGVTL